MRKFATSRPKSMEIACRTLPDIIIIKPRIRVIMLSPMEGVVGTKINFLNNRSANVSALKKDVIFFLFMKSKSCDIGKDSRRIL